MDIKINNDVDLSKVISILSGSKKDIAIIEKNDKEFNELNRKDRDNQIGNIQKDKIVKNNDGISKIVTANRIPIALANKIVNTAVGFEFGKPVKLTPSEENALSDQVFVDWKNARLDDKIQKAKVLQKTHTQSALLFHYKDLKPNGFINKVLGVNNNRQISCKVLDSMKSGEFFPYFDETGDMKFFVHQFKTTVLDDKLTEIIVDNCWIYDDVNVNKLSNTTNSWVLDKVEAHGFSKIPAVYMSQDKPEHYLVKDAIDRIEVCISRLGASNDYSGHPILFIEGEVFGMPDKNSDGKAMKTKVKYEDGKKVEGGDARFLTHDNAPESVKLEIEKLEDYIYSMTSTPNISFNNLKGMGNVATRTLEFMFMDANIKKLMNEGQNRTDIERCINIIISGIITTSKASLKSMANSLTFDIEFGNVMPNDFDELVVSLVAAVEGGIMSKETAIEMLGEADDYAEELKKILNNIESVNINSNTNNLNDE
ncbi:portal protein [Cellulophaga phage Nekkels_1]|uniref:Portal protein n=1 Tax=Cellulophaga phage Nekkels_1 TaxID=2745692 RepID=A0A8E4XVJ3_9CAUD|nr:portal protein [Cellulophaga phage Nekkels_1]QQO97039.1 portal protein [Cellulophaga phage Nekkels_1]QQO97132.1 portal protein [Cellulophaga phage Nekkels_2]